MHATVFGLLTNLFDLQLILQLLDASLDCRLSILAAGLDVCLLEHDSKKPLGRAQSIMAQDDALYATFKVSATSRGNDALIEASEDLRSGLSVGVEVLDSKQVGNTLEIISARLEEVSLVSNPAFKSAEVLEVAASAIPCPKDYWKPASQPVVWTVGPAVKRGAR